MRAKHKRRIRRRIPQPMRKRTLTRFCQGSTTRATAAAPAFSQGWWSCSQGAPGVRGFAIVLRLVHTCAPCAPDETEAGLLSRSFASNGAMAMLLATWSIANTAEMKMGLATSSLNRLRGCALDDIARAARQPDRLRHRSRAGLPTPSPAARAEPVATTDGTSCKVYSRPTRARQSQDVYWLAILWKTSNSTRTPSSATTRDECAVPPPFRYTLLNKRSKASFRLPRGMPKMSTSSHA